MAYNIDYIKEVLTVALEPIGFGFGIATFLQLLSYGVFRAFAFLNTKNY